MIIELGVLVAALGYFGGISGLTYVGAGILVLGIVMLTMGEGIKGPIELPSLMGNALVICPYYRSRSVFDLHRINGQ